MTVWSGEAIELSQESRATGRGLTLVAVFCLSLLVFCASAAVAFLLRTDWAQLASLGFSGTTVPDALSLEKSVYLAWSNSWDNIPNIRTFLGTVIVYFPITLWGSGYAAFANVIMLAAAATLYYSILQRVVDRDRQTGIWLVAIALVSSNFYVIACIFYPNKEIPLILLSTLALWGLLYGKWPLVVVSIVLCYWFRDGYALIMAMVLVVALSRRFAFVSGGVISGLFLVLLFLAFPIADLSAVDASLQRNVKIGSLIAGDKFSAFGDIAAYLARLIGNAFNLGLRPQMADVNGGINLLGIGYWQFGIILLGGLFWGARNVLTDDVSRSITALVVIVVLLGISYGTFVQPRYMMPLIFPLTLGLTDSPLGRYIVIPAAIFFPLLFLVAGVLPPLADA